MEKRKKKILSFLRFFNRKEAITPGEIAWKKFRRNSLAFGGFIFIVISLLIAILGYLITPDSSPHANEQVLEIATRKPGFRSYFLKVRKNEILSEKGFFNELFYGKSLCYISIPFHNIQVFDERVEIQEFTEFTEEKFTRSWHIADVVYPLAFGKPPVNTGDGNWLIHLANGEDLTVSHQTLINRVKSENIQKRLFLLGTDRYGRDMLSRMIIGARVSLSVGFIAVIISLFIGTILGLLAGYYGGRTDDFIMWLINVIWTVPTLLMVIAITLVLGRGFWQVFVAVGLTMWVEVARVVRGQVMSIKENEYIEAARALGYPNSRILRRHILPNVIDPVIIISAANFSSAILIEAGLSFLGIGVQPPVPSWGSMIRDHYGFIIVDLGYLAFIPGLAIMLMVLSFTLVGNGLRDAFDPKGK